MTIERLEVSNPAYTPENTQYLTIHSSHLGRRHDVTVYNVNAKGKHVPIIILMHGVYGNHWVWTHLGGIDKVFEKVKAIYEINDFILVMPSDGGLLDGSAYLPTTEHGDFEQWIMDDVLTAVIETVKNVDSKSNLYLSGLSMGGYGALRMGFKYADKVAAISVHSPITAIEEISLFSHVDLINYDCEHSQESNILYWAKCCLSDNKNLPSLRFDCGKQDKLYQGNVAFSKMLDNLNIEHQFDSFSGEHSWEYWHKYAEQSFLFFDQHEQKLRNLI